MQNTGSRPAVDDWHFAKFFAQSTDIIVERIRGVIPFLIALNKGYILVRFVVHDITILTIFRFLTVCLCRVDRGGQGQ